MQILKATVALSSSATIFVRIYSSSIRYFLAKNNESLWILTALKASTKSTNSRLVRFVSMNVQQAANVTTEGEWRFKTSRDAAYQGAATSHCTSLQKIPSGGLLACSQFAINLFNWHILGCYCLSVCPIFIPYIGFDPSQKSVRLCFAMPSGSCSKCHRSTDSWMRLSHQQAVI